MNKSMEHQLGDYGQHLQTVVENMTVPGGTELMAQPTADRVDVDLGVRLGWRRFPGWGYAGAAAAIVLLLVGGTAWLTSFVGGETQPAVTQPTAPTLPITVPPPSTLPPTTAATSPTTAPTTTATTSAIEGERIVPENGIVLPRPLAAETLYKTNTYLEPVLRVTPPDDDWAGLDTGCKGQLGSLRLGHELGRMFIVPTPDLTVHEAIGALVEGPLEDQVLAATVIAGWEGQRINATLSSYVWPTHLGRFWPGATTDTLLPYHTVQEAPLTGSDYEKTASGEAGEKVYGPLEPGDQVTIHVVTVGKDVLSVVLVTEPDSMSAFQTHALELAETLEVIGEPNDLC